MSKMTSKKAANNGSNRQQKMLEKLAIALMKGISVNPRCVVYDDFAGFPLQVVFLDRRWWVVTPGEQLQPLDDYFEDDDIGFRFLCEARGTVGALARMLGKALANPEDAVDEVLRHRVESLKRLGVTLDVKDEALTFELQVFSNEGTHGRQGNFSMWCHVAGNICELMFDIDAFESKKDAEQWAGYYFDCLEQMGIECKIV